MKNQNRFIGFDGLHTPEITLLFTPCVEIGWRLSVNDWGNGYATEAATASLKFAFETFQINEIVSFTSPGNTQSQKVMERLHMKNTGKNFEHPSISKGHDLQMHVCILQPKHSGIMHKNQGSPTTKERLHLLKKVLPFER